VPFRACGDRWLCGAVAVPIDYAGKTPGFLKLAVQVLPSTGGVHRSAVVGLAGGPGQSALGFSDEIAGNMKPFLHTNDLIVYDQRGTGANALWCGKNIQTNPMPKPSDLTRCAQYLGKQAAYYSSQTSARDINAIRALLHEQKLTLYGVSYGTLVAQDYARMFPTHTSALILDSPVPVGGGDVWGRGSFAAIPGVLDYFCAGGCSWLNGQPISALFRQLLAKLQTHPLRGITYDGKGRPYHYTVTDDDLITIMMDEARNDIYSQQLPGAIVSALQGNGQLLYESTQEAQNNQAGESSSANDLSGALYWATTCEDMPEPWTARMDYAQRARSLRAAFAALSTASLAGFSRESVWNFSTLSQCIGWPTTSKPFGKYPYPNIPVLILHGTEDALTPLSNAQGIATHFPKAIVVTVPNVGHDVLDGEAGDCGSNAVAALAAGVPISSDCPAGTPISPTPPLPSNLDTVQAQDGGAALPEKLLNAAGECLTLGYQFVSDSTGLQGAVGGYYGGYVTLAPDRSGNLWTVTFHNYSCIPGVTLSGAIGYYGCCGAGSGGAFTAVGAGETDSLAIDTNGILTGPAGSLQIVFL
jgi:pimeloyl-ACP methyl ester carboxylesterase